MNVMLIACILDLLYLTLGTHGKRVYHARGPGHTAESQLSRVQENPQLVWTPC